MRMKLSVAVLVTLWSATLASAKDVYLPITGSVGTFKTDARVVNPSSTKEITITATFEPVVGSASPAPRTANFTVGRRQQRVFDDVVSVLFSGATGLGAIRFSSPDDFVATARIFATVSGGTAGQGYAAVDVTAARNKGLLLQLKSTGNSGQLNTFRSNIGFVNPGSAAAVVTLRLNDKNNVVVSTQTLTVPARSSLGPANYFGTAAGDFTDAFASFSADNAVIAYASIIDNGTTDPTFLPAIEDTGTEPAPSPQKIINVSAQRFNFTSDVPFRVKLGDRVTLRLRSVDVTHGFSLPQFNISKDMPAGQTVEATFDANQTGTFFFFCTVFCGGGHGEMSGQFTVEP